MTRSPLCLGLIGCGWVAQFYGQAARLLADRCVWAWAADPDLARAEAFCGEFGGTPRTALPAASDTDTADAYIIATPHHLHASQYLELAATGKPVLIEKPLALTVAECDAMIAARDHAHGLLMVGYVNRYRQGPQTLKRAVESGVIGAPLFAQISQLGNQEGYVGGWILQRATLGGGCFFSSAGHLLDLLYWFHGPFAAIHLERAHFRLPMEGEDTALAVVRHQNGVLATVTESWCSKGQIDWQTYTIFGEEGSLAMTYTPRGLVPEWGTCLWDARVELRRDQRQPEFLLQHTAPFEFQPQFEHFLDCIEQGRTPLTDAESAREIIRAVRRAERCEPGA